MSTPRIEIKREFNIAAEVIYDSWLDPKAIAAFMKPADIISVPEAEIDAIVGGKFKFDMHAGENIFPHSGVYRVLDRATKIQFTWNSKNTNNEDSIVTIDIEALSDSSCHLTLTHELLPTENSRDDHSKGWENILKHLSSI